MNKKPLISIIFPAKNEGEHIRKTLESLFSMKTDYPFEAIVVNDGSTDNCCDFINLYYKKEQVKLIETLGVGAANARNIGAAHAKGEYFIFCDAHLLFEDWWIDRLTDPLMKGRTDAASPGIASTEHSNIIGYGQTLTPKLTIQWNPKQNDLFETAVLPGGCFIISKAVFNQVGGFETGFRTWGHEDVELSIKLWLFGYRCHVQPNVNIRHVFRTAHPYRISSDDVNYNLLRMAFSHFNPARIQKCKNMMRPRKARAFESHLLKEGIMKQRETYFQKRTFDDSWYFNKFKINF